MNLIMFLLIDVKNGFIFQISNTYFFYKEIINLQFFFLSDFFEKLSFFWKPSFDVIKRVSVTWDDALSFKIRNFDKRMESFILSKCVLNFLKFPVSLKVVWKLLFKCAFISLTPYYFFYYLNFAFVICSILFLPYPWLNPWLVLYKTWHCSKYRIVA